MHSGCINSSFEGMESVERKIRPVGWLIPRDLNFLKMLSGKLQLAGSVTHSDVLLSVSEPTVVSLPTNTMVTVESLR